MNCISYLFKHTARFLPLVLFALFPASLLAIDPESQVLAANARRLVQAFELLGQPFDSAFIAELETACLAEDAIRIQTLLDTKAFCIVSINPESRVKAERGAAKSVLQQSGYIPFLIRINNQGAVKTPLLVQSPQAGPSYAGVAELSMQRQDQLALRENEAKSDSPHRFLYLDFFSQSPLSIPPSGASIEYAILLIYCAEAGSREATLNFSAGPGTQDLGFRAELPVVFESQPAIPVRLSIKDFDGTAAYAKLTIRDGQGHIYPPQPRRIAPDLFFQAHIYRQDGETVLLPPGEFSVESSRGPEYVVQQQSIMVNANQDNLLRVQLSRWVNPMDFGFYCGDHHIHGAGCAHYTSPTEGVTPRDMFRQVAGEGLNVGCILTWGPCFEFQRQFFRPNIDDVSQPKTILKYDLEISGFGSQALGHVCLLNLKDQTYPGSNGTKETGWPTWTTPALRWAKDQGALTGFAHSASGLQINPANAAKRLMAQLDADQSQLVTLRESEAGLLPDRFERIDADSDGFLSQLELQIAIDKATDILPNLAVPEMDSVGAMELPVAVAAGVCDFISAMDTPRVAEWNMWYHILNCGFPLKVSGETDFPCMSGQSVGQGRTYVWLGAVDQVDFGFWCQALASGRSYVSDGFAHALEFSIASTNDTAVLGETLDIPEPAAVTVKAKVAFAPQVPESVAYGTRMVEGKQRFTGDTVTLHGPRSDRWIAGGQRMVELVANGVVVASQSVPADGQTYDLEFQIPIQQSSWIALRCFPQLHTNPVNVIVSGKPLRASAASARWCEETIHQLWRMRINNIAASERPEAEQTFRKAIEEFRHRASNSSP